MKAEWIGLSQWRQEDLRLAELLRIKTYHEGGYELDFHLRPAFWHRGLATEEAGAVVSYAFVSLGEKILTARHNPRNTASRKVLEKLDFRCVGEEFYELTGLYYPLYKLKNGLI